MNEKLSINLKSFRRKLSSRIVGRFFIEIAVFTIAIMLIYLLGWRIFHLRTWHGNEFLYPFLHFLNLRSELFIILILFIGFVIIFLRAWSKPLRYLEDIINATENIFNAKGLLIQLPQELKEVEVQMNEIKLNIEYAERTAKEAEQRKNDLVVYLAHDLKTPLTSVVGYLTLLRDEGEISQELQDKYLSIALNKSERLEDLINEFFEITRFNLTNITLEMGEVNLTRMVEQLIFEFKPMLDDKNLDCVLEIQNDLHDDVQGDIHIKCDIDKMQRVLDNLLRNAVNYSFEDSTIIISIKELNDKIEIKFTNQGHTIPRDKLNRIFEQFYRLDSARGTAQGGSGVGLAISKEIIELHKGIITAFSEDEMIEFMIHIPSNTIQ